MPTPEETRCPVCGSSELTPRTRYRIPGAGGVVEFADPAGGWLSREVELPVQLARVCRACGHVMLFLGREAKERLDAVGDRVQPGK